MRKFIRKLLKALIKEDLLRANAIESNKYNSDKLYKLIKKFQVPYHSLTKETILEIILNHEKNSRIEGRQYESLLRTKTVRKHNTRSNKKATNSRLNVKLRNEAKMVQEDKNEFYRHPTERLTRRGVKTLRNAAINHPRPSIELTRTYSEDTDENKNNINVIIDKSLLFKDYMQEEAMKKRKAAGNYQNDIDTKHGKYFVTILDSKFETPNTMEDTTLDPQKQNLSTKNFLDHYLMDYPKPLVPPMNYGAHMFPTSTKNQSSINMDLTGHPEIGNFSNLTSPQNKEINMNNKILINEPQLLTIDDRSSTNTQEPVDAKRDKKVNLAPLDNIKPLVRQFKPLRIDTDVNEEVESFGLGKPRVVETAEEEIAEPIDLPSNPIKARQNNHLGGGKSDLSPSFLKTYVSPAGFQIRPIFSQDPKAALNISPKSAFAINKDFVLLKK